MKVVLIDTLYQLKLNRNNTVKLTYVANALTDYGLAGLVSGCLWRNCSLLSFLKRCSPFSSLFLLSSALLLL